MSFFDNLYRLSIWGLSFGVLAYVLWRWGKVGFIGLPGVDIISEFFKMIWDMIREHPIVMVVIPIITLLIGVSYIMK
jgi:hypothetical protein